MFSLSSLGTRSKGGVKARIVIPLSQRYFSDDSGESDEKKKAAANEKLANLLKGLKTTNDTRKSPDRELKLAKPGFNKHIKREKDGKPARLNIEDGDLDEDVVTATKGVARMAKTENKKRKTESDLLKKLMSVSQEAKDAKKDNEVAGESDASPSVSMSSLIGDMKIEKSKPLKKSSDPEAFDTKRSRSSEPFDKKELTMEQMAFLQKRAKMRRTESVKTQQLGSVDLFSGTPLGIFTEPLEESSDKDLLKTWRACEQRELKILSTPSPRNRLEEMVLLTKQGKLWHFPVDNEQGWLLLRNLYKLCLEHQLRNFGNFVVAFSFAIIASPSLVPANILRLHTQQFLLKLELVTKFKLCPDYIYPSGLDYSDDPFYEHVFLEHHLDPWCPKMGPVRYTQYIYNLTPDRYPNCCRHFMEVVCLGLSKNPYVSSVKKQETILWFKEYFERPDNTEILVHSGFWEDSSEENSATA